MKTPKSVRSLITFCINKREVIIGLLFLYSIPIAFAGLLIESFRYFGYLKKFGIDTSIVILISIYLGLATFFTRQKSSKINIVYHLLSLFLAGVTFILVILSSSEIYKGIGHIRTEFNLSLSTILAISMYTLLLLLLPVFRDYFKSLPKKYFWKSILLSVVVTYVMFFRVQTLFDLMLARSSRALELIAKNDKQRVGSLWGHSAAFLNFVVEHTPKDAIILHPIQDYPWPEVGNQYVARRFLYPRTLIAPEWGKGTPTHILVDDGSPNRENYSDKVDRMGWPIDIVPSRDVLFMNPWKKKIIVESVQYWEDTVPLKVAEIAGEYTGEITISPTFDNTTIEAEFTKLQYAFVSLTEQLSFSDQSTFRINLLGGEAFSTAPVLIVTSKNSAETFYIYFEPNIFEGSETLLIPNPFQRFIDLLAAKGMTPTDEYQVVVALDVGYSKPMPFMYSKGVLTIPTTSAFDTNCQIPIKCLYQLEELVYKHKFTEATEMIPLLKTMIPFNGYFNYLTYLTMKETNRSETEYIPYLRNAARFWSSDITYNLPKNLLNDYEAAQRGDIPTPKKGAQQ